MQPGIVWLVAGAVLLVLEVLLPGVFLMWLGLAGLGTGALVLATGIGLGVQVVSAAFFAAIAIGVGLRLRGPKGVVINTAQAGLIGRDARVLRVEGGTIRVRVGDSDWSGRDRKSVV